MQKCYKFALAKAVSENYCVRAEASESPFVLKAGGAHMTAAIVKPGSNIRGENIEVGMRERPLKTMQPGKPTAKINLMLIFILALFICLYLPREAQADTQTAYPTGDNSATGTWTLVPASPTTRWDKVDEVTADDATSYIAGTAVGNALFNLGAFTVPVGSTITDLTVYYRHEKTTNTACNIGASIRVNGINYIVDPGVNPVNGTWTTSSYAYTTNPNTGAAWTVADINGTGANPLQAFGVNSTDVAPNPYVTQVYAVVTYTPPAAVPSVVHNSVTTGSSKWSPSGWGIGGGRYGTFTCETCHTDSTTNIKKIKSTVIAAPNTPTNRFPAEVGGVAPVFSQVSGAPGTAGVMGDDSTNPRTSSNKICEGCHTYDATGASGTKYHAYSGGINNSSHQNNAKDCTGCHKHSQGFKAPACNTCHGNPPTDATSGGPTGLANSPNTTGSITAGAHSRHALALAFGCSNCHSNQNMPQTSTVKPGFGDISIAFSNFGSTTGSYTGQTGLSYNNTLGTGGLTCSTVYCHGSTINAVVNPTWTGAVVCGDCHKATNADPPILGAHQRHAASGTYGAGKQGLGLLCSDCHGSAAGGIGHVDGSVSWSLNTASNKFSATANYNSQTTSSTGGRAPSGTYGSCNNTYCHSTVTGNGGVAGTYVVSPAWNNTTTCASCHSDQTAGFTGTHSKHTTAPYSYACATCHTGAGAETTKHADHNVDVAISATYGGTYSGSVAPGDAYGNCSTVYCHSQGTSTVSPPAPNVTASWGGTLDTFCTGCHSGNASATNKMASNAHSAHINDTGNRVGRNIGCAECHGATVSADRTLLSAQYHVNKLLNVRFSGTSPLLNGDLPTYNGLSAQSTVAGGATANPGSQAACANVYCHSVGNLADTTGSGAVVAVGSPLVSFRTITWNTGTIDCTSCHGTNGSKSHPNYTNGGVGSTTANTHVQHVENSKYSCDFCHNTTTTDTAVYPALPTTVIAGGQHLNRIETVSFKSVGGKTGTYNGAVTFKTCSTTYCHGSGTPAWGGTALTCAQCHSDMGAGTGAHLYQGAHSQHTNSTAYLFDCENCHDSSQRVHAGGNADSTAPVQAGEVKFEASGTAGTWLTSQYNGGGSTFKYTRINQEPYTLSATTPTFTKGLSAGATSPDPTGSFAWTKGTCTNVWCHSTGLRLGIAGIVYRTTPAWDGTITTCNVCHRANGDTYATMTNVATTDRMSQGHAQHIASDKYVLNTNFTCNTCHFSTASNMTTISSYTYHVNGAKNVSLNSYAGTAPTWDGVAYTCGNTYCHSNGTGGTSNVGDTRGVATNTSLAWTGTTTCTSCHGNPPSYTNGTPKANSHTAHSSYTCDKCHYATTTTGNTITGFTTHVNKLYNLSNSGATLTYTYALGGGNCTIAACHGAGNPTWGGPSLKCSDCHLSTAADLNNYTYGDNTAANINTTQWSYSGHGKTTGSYDVTLNPAANFPGAVTTGDPCQYCHDSTVVHGDTVNAFRLRNFADATYGKNGTCMKCHGTGQTGVNPGTGYSLKTATIKIDKYHYDITNGKHSTALNGGQFCWDCHDPHGDSTSTAGPIAMIQLNPAQASDPTTGEPTTTTATAVVFSSDTAPSNFGNSTGNGICNVCHTYKAADPNKMVHYYNTTPFTDSHNSTTICTNCHKHSADTTYNEKAWAGAGACTDCHAGTQGSRRNVVNDFTANTSRHVFGGTVTNFDCIVCHAEGDKTSAGTTIKTIATEHGGDAGNTLVALRNVDSVAATEPGTLGTNYWRWPGSATATNTDYQNLDMFCLNCHDANGASGIAVNNTNNGLLTGTAPGTTTRFGTTSASLAPFNTSDGLGAAGRATGSVYNATYNRTRLTDIKSKVNDSTYYAWHAIGVTGYPKPYTNIAAPNNTWVAAAWASYVPKGATQNINVTRDTTTLHCADCHTIDDPTKGGAHGSNNAFMLVGTTVDNTCYVCHSSGTYASGGAEANSRFDHASADSNVWTATSSFTGYCRNCHGGDPATTGYGGIHGIKFTNQRSSGTNSYRFVGGTYMTYKPNSWTTASGTNGTCYFTSKAEPFSSCTHHAAGTSAGNPENYARGLPGQY